MTTDLIVIQPAGADLPTPPSPGDLVDMFLSGRNPRTMAAYSRDLDDLTRFLGATDWRAALEFILSAEQGPTNAWGLALAERDGRSGPIRAIHVNLANDGCFKRIWGDGIDGADMLDLLDDNLWMEPRTEFREKFTGP